MIFGTCIIAFGIASFVYDASMGSGLKNMKCSLISFTDDVIFGATYGNTTWIGIYPV